MLKNKFFLVVFLVLFGFSSLLNAEFKLRTNGLATLFGILNLEGEYVLTDEYSVSFHGFHVSFEGEGVADYDDSSYVSSEYEIDFTAIKYGVMGRYYFKKDTLYTGFGISQFYVDSYWDDLLDSEDPYDLKNTFTVIDLKFGVDDFIFGRKKILFNKMIFMGLSAGAYFVLDPERTLDNGDKVKPIGEVVPNVGVTLGVVF